MCYTQEGRNDSAGHARRRRRNKKEASLGAYHQAALTPGSRVAEYIIESVLGHGGFGITYLARDEKLGAQVAIKEYLPAEVAGRTGEGTQVMPQPSKDAIKHYHWGLRNFVREAQALARFKHENIVRVLRFIETNGTAYTVMEYERGQTLAQHLKETRQRLNESALFRIIMPILNGLQAVHEAGLLHLDIKPENIYLREDGRPMLIDFGSARQAMSENRPSGRVALTRGYAAVEQYPDKGQLGPWSDVYALGATMYRCITGQHPADALERYRAVLAYQADPLVPIGPDARRFRATVIEGVKSALQIHAKDRPQSARELQDYLVGRAQPRLPAGAPPGTLPADRPRPRLGLRGLGWITVVLSLASVAGFVALYGGADLKAAWDELYRVLAAGLAGS